MANRMPVGWLPYGFVGLLIGIGIVYFFTKPVTTPVVVASGESNVGCNIKGNISASGERIYHMPGQRYYAATHISTQRGDRWFCSEEEARKAGWRKARV